MPRIPVSTKCRQQTADRIQNIDCRLQSGYKMQTENLKSFYVWYIITRHLTAYRASRNRFSAISQRYIIALLLCFSFGALHHTTHTSIIAAKIVPLKDSSSCFGPDLRLARTKAEKVHYNLLYNLLYNLQYKPRNNLLFKTCLRWPPVTLNQSQEIFSSLSIRSCPSSVTRFAFSSPNHMQQQRPQQHMWASSMNHKMNTAASRE